MSGVSPDQRRPARTRSTLRTVALPAEHGGWGLTAEPVLLGLLLAPSWAGVALGVAAMTAFVARTPIKIALGDLRRGRRLDRTRVALVLGMTELALLGTAVAAAVALSDDAFWLPLVLAVPLLGTELAYDIRARGRRLVPELAGSVGVASVSAMIVLAAGHGLAAALGTWAILAARALTSIPHVRDQVRRLHGRSGDTRPLLFWDASALFSAIAPAVVVPELIGGAMAIATLVVAQRWSVVRPAPTAIVLGIRQTLMGLAVVLVTWVGVVVSGGLP